MKYLLAALATAAVAALAAPCAAQPLTETPLSAEELSDMRGGFILPTGVEANFGAVARTFSDDTLLLETHFTWTELGVQRENVVVSPVLGDAGDALPDGFVLQDFNGATIFAHQAEAGAIRNILLNDANGRNLRSEIQMTVTLPGFAAVQQDYGQALLSLRLTDDLNAINPLN